MGERKGVNKYYPPDWDPSKGSINQYVGQHPLRDRAKKLGQGILVIRFEMPYNIWCGGCNSHIGMGVRYNAEKSKNGMYYTTPIYKFRMKCHLCPNYFEIVTDPKNHDYVIVEGARRKEQRWDPKENGQIVTEDKSTQKKMATDAMFKLEHGSDDIQKGKKAISHIGSLEARREDFKDDYLLNKLARQKFREEKKVIKVEADSDSALLLKSSLDIPLQKETEEDVKLAALIKYRTLESYDERQVQKRKEIESRPLFLTANKLAKIEDKSPENKKLDIIKKHIRTARANTHTSPFDRMNMNTLGGGSIISKQSIGIRRKSLPVFTDPVSKANEGGEHKKESENVMNDGTKSDDSETVEINSIPSSKHCNETDEAEDNVDCSENSRHNFAENRLNCGSRSKLVSEGSDEMKVDCSPTCVCDNQSALYDNSSSTNIATGDGADIKTAESEKEGSSVQLKPRQSALGLVCAYSDTDSDT